MKTVALKELHELETSYWWHVGRFSIIEQRLKRIAGNREKLNILNVGSGTGGTLPTISKFGKVTNIDTSTEALDFLKASGYKGKLVKGIKLPFKDNTFDIITALDVLEHIKDDNAALKEWQRVLKPGGSLLLTVPAYQWLWSQHDVINNHYRRYIKKDLKKKISQAGFSIRKSSYAIVFSFPLVVGSRFVSKISKQKPEEYSSFVKLPESINNLFINFLKLEAKSLNTVSFPFGTSVIVVAHKSPRHT